MNGFIQAMRPRIKSAQESMYLLTRNHLSLIALIVLILLIIAALLAPVIIVR